MMNIYVLSIIDKRIEEAMIKFSRLPRVQSAFYYNRNKQLLSRTKKLLDFYILFFKEIGFLPVEHDYYKRKIRIKSDLENTENESSDKFLKKLIALLKTKLSDSGQDRILPIHLHYSTKSEILLAAGVVIIEDGNTEACFLLHEVAIPKTIIKNAPQYLQYLQNVLKIYRLQERDDIHQLSAHYHKSYNRFQKDCKEYFGDTFYQFYTKMKIMDAVDDILFSELSLKEIAYKNNFTSYNHMYKIFNKRYDFALINIPRFFYEI